MFKLDGDKFSEMVTEYLGSWRCIRHYLILITIWCIFNTVLAHIPFLAFLSVDQWPFQALNLILGGLASISGPLVMISQKKADKARDELLIKISRIEDSILNKVEEDIAIDKAKLEE
jgi:uncharacterized membrane protein